MTRVLDQAPPDSTDSGMQDQGTQIADPTDRLTDGASEDATHMTVTVGRDCQSLLEHPCFLTPMPYLEELTIETDDVAVTVLPEAIGNLTSLRVLRLLGFMGYLEDLPTTIGRLVELEELDIHGCGISTLPDSIGNLESLTDLQLSDCELRSLPATFGRLKSLESLYIKNCGIRALPDSIGDLPSLRHLTLRGCYEIRTLPTTIGGLQELQQLELKDTSLTRLPRSVGNLKGLQYLNLVGNHSMRALPPTIGGLRSLESIYIILCPIAFLPDTIGSLKSLHTLHISMCKELQTLPATIGQLESLEELVLWDCEAFDSLPAEIGCLTKLKWLQISNCYGCVELPEELGQLRNLKRISFLQHGEDWEKLSESTMPPRLEQFFKGKRFSACLSGPFSKGGAEFMSGRPYTALCRFLKKNPYVKSLGYHEPTPGVQELLTLNRFRKFLDGGEHPKAVFPTMLAHINNKLRDTPSDNAVVVYSLLRTQSRWL